jgi:hypothetical protein
MTFEHVDDPSDYTRDRQIMCEAVHAGAGY